jgi:hypothetical protein
VPLSPKEKDNDDDSDVRVVSSVGDAPRDRSPRPSATKPLVMKANPVRRPAVCQVHQRSTSQSASPSATSAEKDDSGAEVEEEDEPESNNYRVTLEAPQVAAAQIQIPSKAKLIGGKQIGTDEWWS